MDTTAMLSNGLFCPCQEVKKRILATVLVYCIGNYSHIIFQSTLHAQHGYNILRKKGHLQLSFCDSLLLLYVYHSKTFALEA